MVRSLFLIETYKFLIETYKIFIETYKDFVAKGHENDAYRNKNYGDKCTKFEFMSNGWPYNIIAEAIAFGKKNALRTKKH